MYKVILVDDEEWIIKSLKKRIPWNEYGFEVCAVAANGKDALEKINKLCPDVIFTDIKMPYMDGLDLIANAKKIHPNLLSVIISGYEDFQFAKTAIQYKVDGYCIKPLEEEEIIGHLRNFEVKLYDIKQAQKRLDLLNCIENNDKRILKELFLHSQKVNIIVSIGNEIAYFREKPQIISCNISFNKWIYFTPRSIDIRMIKRHLGLGVKGVGIFEMDIQTDDLLKSIDEANIRAHQYFFDEVDRVFYDDYDRDKIKFYNKALNDTVTQVKDKDIVGLNRSINNIRSILPSINIKELKKSYDILNILKGMSTLQDDGGYIDDNIIFLSGWDNVYEYFDYFCYEINLLININSKSFQRYSGENELIFDVIEYIEDNYKEKLTLYDLSSEFHVSESYLSQLFKNETGINFITYLTDYRMSKACNLLLRTDMLINDIAREVGYDDYLYFRKVFKRTNAMTPTEYRRQKRKAVNDV